MRFLMVSHFFESHGGGIERVAGHLCRNLVALKYECNWVASSADPAPRDPEIHALALLSFDPMERLTGLPMPIPRFSGLLKLARAVKKSDCVIIHDALYVTSIATMLLAKSYRKPVILIQHISEIPFSSKIMRYLMKLANRVITRPMLSAADQVVFISETVREALEDYRFARPPRVLFNGVDDKLFCAGPGERARFGLPDVGQTVAFVGRFVEKKGLTVIHALARLRPDITFALVGFGPIAPTSWQLPNVRTLGRLSPAEVGALFRSVDSLILPSVGEGYPLVIQEAMSSGLRVLCGTASACADLGARRWLEGINVSLLDPVGTAESFSSALDASIMSDAERTEMMEYARATYSWRSMASAIGEISAGLK